MNVRLKTMTEGVAPMKSYYEVPVKHVRSVHADPENRDGDYEIYLLTPVKIGGARRTSANNVMTDDGRDFPTLDEAVRHVLELVGEKDMARAIPSKSMRRSSKTPNAVTLTGMDLVTRNVWMQFCKLRGFDAKSVTAVSATYILTEPEAKKLGLADDKKQQVRSLPAR